MLAGILRFEWRYHTRRIAFAVATLAFAAMAAFLVGTGYGPDGVDVNAPTVVMQSLGLLSLLAVFVLTIFVADAALRDVEHGMTELILSRPVGKPRYLLGRFTGALMAAMTVMAVAALAMMVAPLVVAVEPGRLGPVRPFAYLYALAVLVLPNLVLAGALLFAVATLTRSALATYVGAVAIYALYMVTALLIDSPLMAGTAPPTPEGLARAAILDPFGLSAFFEQVRYWTPAERDVRTVSLAGHMLLNRLLWLGVAALVMAFTYWKFAFRLRSGGRVPRRSRSDARAAAVPAPERPYRAVTPSAHATWPALRSATRLELRHVLRGWTFLALMALFVFVTGMEAVAELGGGEYGTRLLPTTGTLMQAVTLPLLLLGSIVVVYWSADVAWRERLVGFDALADATPASSLVFYLSKAVALATLPVVMTIVAVVVGIGVQLAHGYTHLQPALWLSLLPLAALPLAFLAIGALALQAIAPNRWIGMLAGLALALVARRGETLGLEHPMLHFGAGPSAPWSDMDGFGPVPRSYAAFMLYWLAVSAVLACVSWGLWRRGVDTGVRARVAAIPRALGRSGRRIAIAGVALLAVVGGALFWRTSVAGAWESRDARLAWRAGYERTYRYTQGMPEPSVVAVRTNVALYPAERRAAIGGRYVLENRGDRAIDTIWVTTPREASGVEMTMDGARLVRQDARYGVRVLALDRPMAPGGRAELVFALVLDRGGIRASGFEYDITANGTMLSSGDAYPTFGYHAGWEVRDEAQRRTLGLATAATALAPLPATESARAALHDRGPQPAWITLDATVSTSLDQTAIAPGRLVRTWEQDGRRFFHYVTDRPITARFMVLSARWAVRRQQHGSVSVEIWHDAAHTANLRRTLAAATRTLDLMGARYGDYPHDALRIVEVPAWAGFGAFALPGIVLFPESRGFQSDARAEEVDLVTRRVAHEVAHQWWGHTVDAADVAGGSTLTETLAKHSEQLVVASLHGERALPPMLAFDEDRYLAGRAADAEPEPTLLESAGQAYIYYGKGAIAMHALRDALGDSAFEGALARFVEKFGGPRGAATTLDLRDLLRERATTPAARAAIDEWLGERVLWDASIDSGTSVMPVGDGRFRLAMRVHVAKWARRGDADVPLPVDGDSVDVAVYDAHPSVGRVLYEGRHRVSDGVAALTVDLPAEPRWVVADPRLLRIDRDRSNNMRRLP